MAQTMAYCGIVCAECGAYKATQANDQAALEKVAAEWRAQFDPNITVADVPCDGCLTTSDRLCSHCAVCPVRACGKERGEINCAHCANYEGCEKLEAFFGMAPELRAVLDGMRRQIAA